MSSVPGVSGTGLYFFYFTSKFDLQCVRYQLVHTLLLTAYYLMFRVAILVHRLFAFCHSNCLVQRQQMLLRCL